MTTLTIIEILIEINILVALCLPQSKEGGE
jgi:hypothetical protein